MNAMLQEAEKTNLPGAAVLAEELGKLLQDHKGADVVVMDMRDGNFWTDFFVIATVTSGAHLSGLERHIKDYARERDLDIRRSPKPDTADEWCLLDLGNIVVHLMSPKSRSFYELERLWGSAQLTYSSKSS